MIGVPPLVKYHLRGLMEALENCGCSFAEGCVAFSDAEGAPHLLVPIKGEWHDSEEVAPREAD